MNIKTVVAKKNGVLFVVAEDGRAGLMDIRPFYDYPAFVYLKKSALFEQVRNGRYFIEWPGGADLSADTIEARWTPIGDGNATIDAAR